jgi:histidyl-tRNA synthetase
MFQRPRGTRDFGPDEMARRRRALEKMRETALNFGFREIQMPTFEEIELFTKKSGPGIVEELYAFKDKGGRDIALRPEMTAQVMRFYVSDLSSLPKPLKLFYYGPCFRYENPQSGRFREFFQFGAEIAGANTPETDAEVIALASAIIAAVGLKGFTIRIGYIGVLRNMLSELKLSGAEIAAALHFLDKNDVEGFNLFASQKFISKETIERILSIRNLKGDIEILDDLNDGAAKDYLKEMTRSLSLLRVGKFQIDLGIIRGLDYYTGVVFEIDAPSLGAEKQICGGGSYDLVPLFGGEQVFTTGFALGFDRVLMAAENEGFPQIVDELDVYVIPVGDSAREKVLGIVATLRNAGLSVDYDLMRRSLSKNMKYASLAKAKQVIIAGEKELAKGTVTLRDMKSGDQKEIKIESLIEEMKK